jgi:purine-binding chemotaxis protein CheW
MNETTSGGAAAGGSQTYTAFRLSAGVFGTAANAVKEVTPVPPLTPIPQAPAAVRGYANLRGHVVLVVDLDYLLQGTPTVLDAESRLVVFRPELGDAFGVLVDRVGDMVALRTEQIEPRHAGPDAGGPERDAGPADELICGVGEGDGALLSIIDAHRLRAGLERAIAARGRDGGGVNGRETAGRSGRPEATVSIS